MIIKKASRLVMLMLATVFPPLTWALPVAFEFTGTISNTVLISRIEQTIHQTSHPEWEGLQVTGVLNFWDLPALTASPNNYANYSQHGANVDRHPDSDWMSFTVRNPDGTILDISDSEPVTPVPYMEGDDAYTHLANVDYLFYQGGSSFYAQRTYDNHLTYPGKHASLSLRADGDNAQWLTNNADYNDVTIQPEFANIDNYGSVYYYTGPGVGYEYVFTIDSLERVETSVPEPSTWLLLISGLFMMRCRSTLRKVMGENKKHICPA